MSAHESPDRGSINQRQEATCGDSRSKFNGHRFEHGTRARYVRGCRCTVCRAANVAAYHERETASKAAAKAQASTEATPIEKLWTAPDGSKRTRLYQRACPGVNGTPCPAQRHLRKDSTGDVCGDCRRQLVWNGLVDAAPARRHLRKLSRRGVGYKSVADASDVGKTTLAKILSGEKRRIRKRTLDQILEVTPEAVSDHGLVPAARTWAMLRALVREYFSKAEVARLLGYKSPALQIGRQRVLARTEQRVERFYRKAIAGGLGR